MTELNQTEKSPYTMSVPDAGRHYFDLGRSASYEAARRGDLPTVWIGGRIFACVRAIERMLDDPAAADG